MNTLSLGGRNVSRETLVRLQHYCDLIVRWNKTINLVSKSSLDDLWNRHIVDSVQFYCSDNPAPRCWLHLGSGGGLPGIVIGCLLAEASPTTKMIFIESDSRKCAFLRTAIRELKLNAAVVNERIETAPSQGADVITARALADLPMLLQLADRHLAKDGQCIFGKGKTWRDEVDLAEKEWKFKFDVIKSITSSDAAILKIREIERG